MYNIFLHAHRGFGYLVLLLCTLLLLSLVASMLRVDGKISKLLRKTTLITMIVFHLQALIGLVLLFVVSPAAKAAMQSGLIMKDAYLRKTFVEHPFSMVVAAVLMTIVNKYMKTNKRLAMKIVIFTFVAIGLVLYAFPFAKVFK